MSTNVTKEFLNSKGFERNSDGIGWATYRKNEVELVEIPLKNGGYVIGFPYQYKYRTKYKYPITISELEFFYKFITKESL